VLRYYHLKDAKMSMASHLLKHLVVTKYCGVSWSQSTLSRDPNGKPCFVAKADSPNPVRIDFNVSHQAGIVSLIAAIGFQEHIDVGTDVVCTNERKVQDYRHIEKDGFFDWVDIHGDVFAESEINHMKLGPVEIDLGKLVKVNGFGKDAMSRCQWRGQMVDVKVSGGDGVETTVKVDSNRVIDAKLRRFYAMWCLREAYVKMTGEALLAPWLKELEITDVQAPAAQEGVSAESLEEGAMATEFDIYFKGKKVTDVRMELSALGTNYMVGGALRVPKRADESVLRMGRWQELDLETDILAVAEAAA
jgi:4'-phosphopantetheinyl transferase